MQKQAATILSAELPGFQSLAETIATKEITPLMGELHGLIVSTIRLHQGRINRYTGDTFLAVFYVNKTGSPASINAVDTILELKDRLDSFIREKKLTPNFALKAGIATGIVICVEIGSGDKKQETVMGEAINHGNRICQFAGEGQILVDENTHEVAKDNCEFQILEPIPLKGSDKALGVFELMGKKRIKLKPEEFSERKISSEMVGRNKEMEFVEVHIKKLMAGEGSVVNIIGKAGIGKSRLIDELKIQPLMKKIVLLEGRALSIGKNLSFHPITHIIKSWAGITEEDLPSVSSEKLQRSINRVAKKKADEIFPFIATMMGITTNGKHKERVAGIEGEALEKLILKNLRDLITAAASIRPLIILIEDLHWADTSSITFLESLFKLVKKTQILFINVLRPGYKETGDLILGVLKENLSEGHITIKIEPLVETESRELIGNLLHKSSLPVEICEMIIRKTEGNPFFIEEVIRSFIDDGIIKIKGSDFFITEKIHQANIPETINEVILSRLDKLDEKTKDLLKTASVIGRNFYYKVLEEAADTIGELDDRIEYLKDVQLIDESKKKEEIELLFKHALAQQATYESIIQNTKTELHLKIARSIEKVFVENLHEHYGSLAHHYGKAENQEKAEEYLIKAGDQSLGSGASSEALSFFKEALITCSKRPGIKSDENKIASLYLKIGLALQQGGNSINAIEYFDKYLKLNNISFPKNKLIKTIGFIYYLFYFIITVYFEKYYYKKSYPYASEEITMVFHQRGTALSSFDPSRFFIETFYVIPTISKHNVTEKDNAANYFCGMSIVFFWTGISMKIAHKILEISRKGIKNKQSKVYANYRFFNTMYEYVTGNWERDDDIESVHNLGMRIGSPVVPIIYSLFGGFKEIETGHLIEAKKQMERILDISEVFENSFAKAQYYRLASRVYNKFRLLDDTLKSTDDGILYTSKTDHTAMLLVIYCNRSIAFSLKNDLVEAETNLEDAEKFVAEKKRVAIYYTAFLLAKTHYATALLNKSRKDKAVARYALMSSNLLIRKSKKAVGNLAEAYRLRANIFWMLNKKSKAFHNFSKAIATSEKYNGKLELSRTYFELGKFLSDPKIKQNQLNGLSGNDYLEKAQSMFEEMDLQWDLEEFQKYTDTGD